MVEETTTMISASIHTFTEHLLYYGPQLEDYYYTSTTE
jgi:hypothetical protein